MRSISSRGTCHSPKTPSNICHGSQTEKKSSLFQNICPILPCLGVSWSRFFLMNECHLHRWSGPVVVPNVTPVLPLALLLIGDLAPSPLPLHAQYDILHTIGCWCAWTGSAESPGPRPGCSSSLSRPHGTSRPPLFDFERPPEREQDLS